MRKGIKILAKVIAVLMLFAIFLPMGFALLLEVDSVQSCVAEWAARKATERLGTHVGVDRLKIGFFNRVEVEGFYVEDYEQDTLLYARRAEVSIHGFGRGGITFGEALLQDACFYLKESPRSVMNVKEVVERMRKRDPNRKKNPFRVAFGLLEFEGVEFRLIRNKERNRPYGVNWSNMQLKELRGRLDDFAVDGPMVSGRIDHLSGRELSGFEFTRLSGDLQVGNGYVGLQNARIETAESQLDIPSLAIRGESWQTYKHFVDSVEMTARFRESNLSTDDIAYFAPGLRDWHLKGQEIDLRISGTVDDLQGRITHLKMGEATSLRADLKMRGLPNVKRTRFDLKIHSMKSDAEEIDQLSKAIARKGLSQGVVKLLQRTGGVELTGRFRGCLSNFEAEALAATSQGTLSLETTISPDTAASRHLAAKLSTRNFRLGELLGEKMMGSTTLDLSAAGPLGGETTRLCVAGDLEEFYFNGKSYYDLLLEGLVQDRRYHAELTSEDEKLHFDLAADVDMLEEPRYGFNLDLRHADLKAMGFNKRDTLSQLCLKMRGDLSGSHLNEMRGEVEIADAAYTYNNSQIRADKIHLEASRSDQLRHMTLRSNYADLDFSSPHGYKEAFEALLQALKHYIPALYPDREEALVLANTPENPEEDLTQLSLTVKQMTPITDAISSGLQVADSTHLKLNYNPSLNHLDLSLNADYIEHDRLFATNLNLSLENEQDSLLLECSARDFYAGAFHLQRIDLAGGAEKGHFNLSSSFTDTTTHFAGHLRWRGELSRSEQGSRRLKIHLLPSLLEAGGKRFDMEAPLIDIDSLRVVVDRFSMHNREEKLLLEGVASRRREDSIRLTLENFDFSPLTQVAASLGYRISGISNGYAVMKSALKESEITADILIDSMRVNDKLPVSPLRLLSRWDFVLNRAAMFIIDRERTDTVIRGYYIPSERQYYARAALQRIPLGVLDPLLKGVISQTQGEADLSLILQGRGRDATLSGLIEAKDLSTQIDYTQVTYRVPEVRILVDGNRLTANNVPFFDGEKNQGKLNFDLNLGHLSNISYSLNVAPRKMLVLNTTKEDNELFYGKVYASGQARISGDKMGVKMDINASTENNSAFYMPLSGSTNVTKADFVTFLSPELVDTSNYLIRRRLMFERKLRQKSKAGGRMDINLGLSVHPNLDFQLVIDPQAGDILRGKGEGLLNIRVNPRDNIFEMTGDIQITEGSYLFTLQNIISKKFLIESGSTISWTGEPMDAMLNINAIYKLKASLQPLLGASTSADRNANTRTVPVECVIHLGDRLSNPSKSFSIRVPQADSETQTAVANILNTETTIARQFIYLLAFNSFYPESSTGSSGNIGAVASAATGFELLANQVSNILSGDDYNIILRYRPKTEVSSDEVDFGFSSNLINDRLLIEVEGNYILDNKTATSSKMSNFMGEAYITWMIDRAGTLKLKGFTQTIDRFDETQGLQETGIGIYYKEDFDNLRDLRDRIRERFSSEKRRERRAQRRAEREAREAERKEEKSSSSEESSEQEK